MGVRSNRYMVHSRLNNNLMMMIEERVDDVLSFYFEVMSGICQHTLEIFYFLTELISFRYLLIIDKSYKSIELSIVTRITLFIVIYSTLSSVPLFALVSSTLLSHPNNNQQQTKATSALTNNIHTTSHKETLVEYSQWLLMSHISPFHLHFRCSRHSRIKRIWKWRTYEQ